MRIVVFIFLFLSIGRAFSNDASALLVESKKQHEMVLEKLNQRKFKQRHYFAHFFKADKTSVAELKTEYSQFLIFLNYLRNVIYDSELNKTIDIVMKNDISEKIDIAFSRSVAPPEAPEVEPQPVANLLEIVADKKTLPVESSKKSNASSWRLAGVLLVLVTLTILFSFHIYKNQKVRKKIKVLLRENKALRCQLKASQFSSEQNYYILNRDKVVKRQANGRIDLPILKRKSEVLSFFESNIENDLKYEVSRFKLGAHFELIDVRQRSVLKTIENTILDYDDKIAEISKLVKNEILNDSIRFVDKKPSIYVNKSLRRDQITKISMVLSRISNLFEVAECFFQPSGNACEGVITAFKQKDKNGVLELYRDLYRLENTSNGFVRVSVFDVRNQNGQQGMRFEVLLLAMNEIESMQLNTKRVEELFA